MDYRKLQNGSDIRGIALATENGPEVNLTPEAVERIGTAFAEEIRRRTGRERPRISVGRDSRVTGEMLSEALIRGICSAGADAAYFGLASTPCMFMSTVDPEEAFDGAVMVTASHLPMNRNGLKFFTAKGGFEKEDIKTLLERAADPALTGTGRGTCTRIDYLPRYAAHLADLVRKGVKADDYDHPLKGFHIVVDAGNGAGGFFADQVLGVLGADTSGSQFLEPDGTFPNHIPNPEDETAMDSLRECVLREKADFGILFDTDVDRAGAVSPDGREINRNRLIALLAAVVLEEHPGSVIVTDSITSTGLAEFIRGLGGAHDRFRRGYRNVINEAIRNNRDGVDSQLAIETSGHGALKENYFLDDGAYLMVKLLIKMARMRREGRQLLSLIDSLREPAESCEVRMQLTCGDTFAQYGKQVLEDLTRYAEEQKWAIAPDNREGLRVSFPAGSGDGWFLLRMSLHDPVMPLNIESDSKGGIHQIAEQLKPFLAAYPDLDSAAVDSL